MKVINHTPLNPQYGKLKESLNAMLKAVHEETGEAMHHHDLFRIEGYLHGGICIQKNVMDGEHYILSASIAFAESPGGDYFAGMTIHNSDDLNLKNISEVVKNLMKDLPQYEEDIEEAALAYDLLNLHIKKTLESSISPFGSMFDDD